MIASLCDLKYIDVYAYSYIYKQNKFFIMQNQICRKFTILTIKYICIDNNTQGNEHN